MEIEQFIELFKEQLENDGVMINEITNFKELEGWDSLTTMLVIGMIKTEYHVDISSNEIKDCDTILDLFNLISKKFLDER